MAVWNGKYVIKESIEKTVYGERLSIIRWETLCSEVANDINGLPIAIGNVSDLEIADLLTPNRLVLGHNNQRSPVRPIWVTGKPAAIITANKKIFDVWFESWLITCVSKLMTQLKWFISDEDIRYKKFCF